MVYCYRRALHEQTSVLNPCQLWIQHIRMPEGKAASSKIAPGKRENTQILKTHHYRDQHAITAAEQTRSRAHRAPSDSSGTNS